MTGRPGPSSVWILCFLLHVISVSGSGRLRPIPDLPTVNFSRLGDLNLGVVLSIHRFEKEALCGNVTTALDVLQRLEAIVFAVEEINNRSDLLPNAKLGFIIVDSCYKELTTLARTLHFIQTTSNSSSGEEASVPAAPTVAVIGTENSPLTRELAAMLSLFKVPVLSYLSSSASLDDKSTYPYFSRTIPSDKMQAMAIVDILRHFGWKYVSIVYADDSYGMEGFMALRKRLADFRDFCLAVTYMLSKEVDSLKYQAVVSELTSRQQARVVVLFMDQALAIPLFWTVKRQGKVGQFTWVCSDAICTNYYSFKGVEDVVSGMICINFISFTVERFERRFRHMTLRTGSRNPWFGEYVSALFNCSNSGPNACDKDREIRTSDAYMPDFTVSLPVNAVYALAHALDAIVKNCTLDKVNQCVKPRLLLDTLRTVRFEGEGGNVSIDEIGNGYSSYDIRNFYIDNGSLVMEKVGEWDTATRTFSYIHTKNVHWGQRLPKESASAQPMSVCNRPCQAGHRVVISYPSCCFSCEACRKDERTVERDKQVLCERCATDKNFTWPDEETRKQCLPIPPTFLQITQLKGIVVLTLDVLVFAMACTVTFVYVKNGENRLIKASSRELSLIMLAGNVLTCVLVVTFVFEPTCATCIIISACFHLSFTLTYAPLLVKTHRIHRIFSLGYKSAARASFVTPRAQVMIATCVISAQILIMCITMGIDPPVPQVTMPDLREKRVHKACYESQFCFIASVSFNLLLMVVCAVHCFKTRNLPANFNEAKFIMFSIYSTVLLWLWFLPTYLSTTDMVGKVLCIAAALLVNVLSSLVFLFLPKLYCVYFVPKAERFSLSALSRRGIGLLH